MWVCARLRPDKYGARLQVAGDPDQPLLPEVEPSKIALGVLALLAAAKDKVAKPGPARTLEHEPPVPEEAPPMISGRAADPELRCVGIGADARQLIRLVSPTASVQERRINRIADRRAREAELSAVFRPDPGRGSGT
jgi:hypothetical protein